MAQLYKIQHIFLGMVKKIQKVLKPFGAGSGETVIWWPHRAYINYSSMLVNYLSFWGTIGIGLESVWWRHQAHIQLFWKLFRLFGA